MFELIEKIMDKLLLPNKHFQDYINSRFDRNEFINIDGNFYALNHSILSVDDVKKCYRFDDIKSTDVILDIGANIGGFAIPTSRMAKQVYAIEPLFHEELKKNVNRNGIKNIVIVNCGLGNGIIKLRYNEKHGMVECYSLSKIINLCGGHIDFLKVDCEGGEWFIKPNELQGIRRIEMEVHAVFEDIEKYLRILDIAGFQYTYTKGIDLTNKICPYTLLVHARESIKKV